MKKAINRTLIALAALTGLAGCAKEQMSSPSINDNGKIALSFSAVKESAATKTQTGDTATDGDGVSTTAVLWSEADSISVFDGNAENCRFDLTGGALSSGGTFSGEVTKTSSSGYTALYPYQSGASWNGSVIHGVSLKAEQTAVPGSFDPEAALLCAQSTDKDGKLEFKSIVSYIKFEIKFECKKITLVSNSTSDILAGTADITPGDAPSAKVILGASHKVSLSAGSGNIAPGTYYIAFFPGQLKNGFKLVFTLTDGKQTYGGVESSVLIERNHIQPLGAIESTDPKEYIPYLTFIPESAQAIKLDLPWHSDAEAQFSGRFEYSTDGGETWYTITSSTGYIGVKGGSKLMLRGKSPYGTGILNERGYVHPYKSCYLRVTDKDVAVACSGDLRTLIDWENYSTVSTDYARFPYLFSEFYVLSSAPELPATKLASRCYCHMFEGNTLLKVAPALPAMKLTAQCYESMFLDCSSLTVASELPATELADNCYYDLFNGTAITEAPELPARTLATYCYGKMFRDTPITRAPELPVTVMADNCYSEMFRGCTQLKAAPKLPATTLHRSCYYGMFNGCTLITEAPELPATTLEYDCYSSMFEGCTALTSAPELPVQTCPESCYANMFSGCTSLKTAPELPATTLGYACYSGMFKDCASLTAAPVLPAKGIRTFCYSEMFKGCSKISEVTVNSEATLQAVQDSSAFDGWLEKAAAAGTVHKRSTLELPTDSASGIPSGWTAVDDVTD